MTYLPEWLSCIHCERDRKAVLSKLDHVVVGRHNYYSQTRAEVGLEPMVVCPGSGQPGLPASELADDELVTA